MDNGLLLLVIISLFIALSALIGERSALSSARARLRLVVQVNGTRGKSTVTRMAHELLRLSGYRCYAKATGTEPRILLPDGSERRIGRMARANVREQRWFMLYAASRGADALVVECNGVLPSAQEASEGYLRADVLILTNARDDHRPELGSAEGAARSFSLSMPRGGSVIGADPRFASLWSGEAGARGSRYIAAATGAEGGPFPENRACIKALADLIGVDPALVDQAATSYRHDPGSLALLSLERCGGSPLLYADATAANDPESSLLAMKEAIRQAGETLPAGFKTCVVLAARRDRPDRSMQLLGMMADIASGRVAFSPVRRYYCVGGLPLSALRRASAIGLRRFGSTRELTDELMREAEGIDPGLLVLAVGNAVGCGGELRAWAEAASRREAKHGL